MSPVCKMADNGPPNVAQKVKVVLFYTETKSVVATLRSFRAHFGQFGWLSDIFKRMGGFVTRHDQNKTLDNATGQIKHLFQANVCDRLHP